jgi:hypothetical protein
VLSTALDRSMGIERPPPAFFYTTHATTLGSLRVVPERNFFSPSARKRVLIVLTDGETREVGPRYARAFLGDGPTADRPREGEKLALMPYATALVLVPLAVVLRRRNFPG